MPVEHRGELVFDQFADNGNVAVSERVGNHVTRRGGEKDHRDRAYDTGRGQGNDDFPEGLRRSRAEVGGGFQHVFIEFDQNGVQGKNGEGQIVVNHADHGVHHAEFVGTVHSDRKEKFFHRRRAKNEIDPHGQDEKHKENMLAFALRAGEDIRDGISDDQTDHRRDDRETERNVNGTDVRRFSEERNEIFKREGKRGDIVRRDFRILYREGEKDDEKQREHNEQRDEKRVRDPELLSRKSKSFHYFFASCFRVSLILSFGILTETLSFSFQVYSVSTTKSSSSSSVRMMI